MGYASIHEYSTQLLYSYPVFNLSVRDPFRSHIFIIHGSLLDLDLYWIWIFSALQGLGSPWLSTYLYIAVKDIFNFSYLGILKKVIFGLCQHMPSFILCSHLIELSFPLPCLPLILVIIGLHRNSSTNFLTYLNIILPWPSFKWSHQHLDSSSSTRVNVWTCSGWSNSDMPPIRSQEADKLIWWWAWPDHLPPIFFHQGCFDIISFVSPHYVWVCSGVMADGTEEFSIVCFCQWLSSLEFSDAAPKMTLGRCCVNASQGSGGHVYAKKARRQLAYHLFLMYCHQNGMRALDRSRVSLPKLHKHWQWKQKST